MENNDAGCSSDVPRRLGWTAIGLGLAAVLIGCSDRPEPGALSEKQPQPVTEVTTKDQTETQMSSENGSVRVVMETSMGQIELELDVAKAPVTCANFLRYVDDRFYDGTVFHRVISGFMIQGGGFTPDMAQKTPRKPIKNEWRNGLSNGLGTIAMARLGNQPDSATCQFFINVQDNAGLDQPRDGAGYAVFGKVATGMDVVDQIRQVRTGNRGGHQDVPLEAVVIDRMSRGPTPGRRG